MTILCLVGWYKTKQETALKSTVEEYFAWVWLSHLNTALKVWRPLLSWALSLSAEKTLHLCECLALCAQSHPPNTPWGHFGHSFSLTDWVSGGLQGSSGIPPALRALNRWHHLSLCLPFTPAHICSYSGVTKATTWALGEGEPSKAAAAAWSSGSVLEQLWKNTAQGETRALPGSCQLRAIRGQMYHGWWQQPPAADTRWQSLSWWCWGAKPTWICANPQGEQPEEKTPVGDQSRGKNKNYIG